MQKLKFNLGGDLVSSVCSDYFVISNPNDGSILGYSPKCTVEEVESAIEIANDSFEEWKNVPVGKRVQILFEFRNLIKSRFDELCYLISQEHGKNLKDSMGDLNKAIEAIEFACSTPSLIMGETAINISNGYDTISFREPLGVFSGIVPFNFPAMIPIGWLIPLCIATGNTMVLKASNVTPMTAFKLVELLYEAGLPKGVVSVLTCENDAAAALLEHEHIKGVSFIGSTKAGKYIYEVGSKNGKRVQALCQAKNHGLVLEDANLEFTADAIIRGGFGAVGERCMALSVVVAEDKIADKLVEMLIERAKSIKIGPGFIEDTDLGPVISLEHKKKILDYIDIGLEEGADLVLDGRNIELAEYKNGYYLGPSIFDHVNSDMRVGQEEIFGPVLCIKRVKDYYEGLEVMNRNVYGNGSIIFTSSGFYARDFQMKTHAGMVGVNVPIPVPVSIFPFTGHKQSFFGDLHTLGKDGIRFFTENKTVTSHWV